MQNPSNGGEWGILGGAFNPIHRGHLALATDICTAKHSNGILFVPSYVPPRKHAIDMAPFEDRVEMLRLALHEYAPLQISTIEAESDSPGYTLLTVRALKKRYPESQFFFIIGADLLSQFDGWYEAAEILKELPIAVGSRPGIEIQVPVSLPKERFESYETALLDISSRDIRAAIRSGAYRDQLIKLVPDTVADYIIERRLYR
jgi:nicotinate-nucleotide adenylyltransferase